MQNLQEQENYYKTSKDYIEEQEVLSVSLSIFIFKLRSNKNVK